MAPATIFNLQTVLSLVAFFLIFKWYILPWCISFGGDQAFMPLLLYSAFRFTGSSMMVPNLSDGLPATFATAAGYGDLTVGVIALIAAIAVKMNLPFGRILVWAYAILGTADFAYVGVLSASADLPNQAGGLWSMLAVGGPSWMITILFIYRLLIWPAPQRKSMA